MLYTSILRLIFLSCMALNFTGASYVNKTKAVKAIQDNVKVFKLKYDFKHFSVRVDTGKHAPINWKSNPSARHFRTVIKDGVKQGVNFAGHYCIIEWGCGTQCQSWVIVDQLNGNIYDGIPTCRGQEYHAGSRLIILDPPEENGTYFDGICQAPTVYEWKNNKLHLLH